MHVHQSGARTRSLARRFVPLTGIKQKDMLIAVFNNNNSLEAKGPVGKPFNHPPLITLSAALISSFDRDPYRRVPKLVHSEVHNFCPVAIHLTFNAT